MQYFATAAPLLSRTLSLDWLLVSSGCRHQLVMQQLIGMGGAYFYPDDRESHPDELGVGVAHPAVGHGAAQVDGRGWSATDLGTLCTAECGRTLHGVAYCR